VTPPPIFKTTVTKLDLTIAPKSDARLAYRYRDGIYASDLLTAALVWLDFFTWLSTRPSTLEQICQELALQPRPADVMVTLFCAMGFLQREGDVILVTDVAREHLVKGSPWFLGPYYGSLKDRPVTKDYLEVLRTGRTANWGSLRHEKEWAKAMETEAFATQFTAAMDCRGAFLGQAVAASLDLKDSHNLLDVAGGSGIYACAVVARHTTFAPRSWNVRPWIKSRGPISPAVATPNRFRWSPRTCSKATGPKDTTSTSSRTFCTTGTSPRSGKFCATLLHRLSPGGLLVLHDAHINREKTGPLPEASYSAMLMHSTEGKCYSIGEMESLLTEAGFHDFHFTPTVVDRSILTARKPKRLKSAVGGIGDDAALGFAVEDRISQSGRTIGSPRPWAR
jgi:hypothetical protein